MASNFFETIRSSCAAFLERRAADGDSEVRNVASLKL
jgi:hypothetical protein